MARKGKDTSEQNERKHRTNPSDQGDSNLGSKHQVSINRGMADLESGPSIGTNVQTRGSGLSTKRSVTGSDYDGQNTVE